MGRLRVAALGLYFSAAVFLFDKQVVWLLWYWISRGFRGQDLAPYFQAVDYLALALLWCGLIPAAIVLPQPLTISRRLLAAWGVTALICAAAISSAVGVGSLTNWSMAPLVSTGYLFSGFAVGSWLVVLGANLALRRLVPLPLAVLGIFVGLAIPFMRQIEQVEMLNAVTLIGLPVWLIWTGIRMGYLGPGPSPTGPRRNFWDAAREPNAE